MRTPPLLSTDPRTASLFKESGCKDIRDSQAVLDALGQAKRVTALARGRNGGVATAVVVADGRVLVVPVGLFASAGPQPLTVAAPSVRLELLQPRFAKPGHSTAVLHTPADRLKIEEVPQAALVRLRQALAAEGAPAAEGDFGVGGRLGQTPPPAATTGDPSGLGPPAVDWRQAEELAVWHLRLLGYADARCTQAGADAGVDVQAAGAVAQVKHWAQPVGQPPLRDLFGVAHALAAKPFFYSLNGYTAQALEWANANNMPLFVYSADGRVLAQNTAAHMLAPGSARIGGGKLGFFEQARADKYRRELERLRQEINDLTVLMHKRTQSRRPAVRRSAGEAGAMLLTASRALDGGDVLPPADRRREDFHRVVKDALKLVKKLL